ncbi:MAG: hypothetical protein OHK0039_22270 [Bacteroidia bacterium]
MAFQLLIGLTTEGPTDARFLTEIIEKTFTAAAFACRTDVVIEGVFPLHPAKAPFTEMMTAAAHRAHMLGINVLCIHADADSATADHVLQHKFAPLLAHMASLPEDSYCKHLVPLIPVQMSEAWMLADTALLRTRMEEQVRLVTHALGLLL